LISDLNGFFNYNGTSYTVLKTKDNSTSYRFRVEDLTLPLADSDQIKKNWGWNLTYTNLNSSVGVNVTLGTQILNLTEV